MRDNNQSVVRAPPEQSLATCPAATSNLPRNYAPSEGAGIVDRAERPAHDSGGARNG